MVAPTSFFSDYGGHIRILEETLALQTMGQRVSIVTYYKGKDISGLDIRRTRSLPWHADYEVGSSRHKLAFDLYLGAKTLKEGIRLRPDIIHGHMHEGALIGGSLARLLRVPIVFDFQGGLSSEMIDHGFLNRNGSVYPWVRRLERYICHMPDAILTSSHQARSLLSREFGVDPKRIHPIPDCVDTARFDPHSFTAMHKEQLRARLGIPPHRPVVAYLGLLTDYQGTPHIVKAAARLQHNGAEVHFLIMGFPNVAYYRTLAHQLGVADRVTFTGRVPYEQAPHFLSLGDVAISPKMSITEGSGKVLNYMAMAQPVVAFDTPVHREYLGRLGVYAPAGDGEALAAAIVDLVRDRDRAISLGVQLRRRAIEDYSWQAAAGQIVALYDSLAHARSEPQPGGSDNSIRRQ